MTQRDGSDIERLWKAWALISAELVALGVHVDDLHVRLDRIVGL